jgi:hypothetical protein
MTKKQQRTELESAINKAIRIAFKEKENLKEHYAEENFRYIVMSKISEIGDFGKFPNINKSDKILCFEKSYGKDFKPDIVSLTPRINGKVKKTINNKNLLAIELKINGKLKGGKSKKVIGKGQTESIMEIKKITSSIERDLLKVREYLYKSGDFSFEYGVVLNIGLPTEQTNKNNYILELQHLLNFHSKHINKASNTSKNLLFGWYNPIINKPEIFWLDQKVPILIGTS